MGCLLQIQRLDAQLLQPVVESAYAGHAQHARGQTCSAQAGPVFILTARGTQQQAQAHAVAAADRRKVQGQRLPGTAGNEHRQLLAQGAGTGKIQIPGQPQVLPVTLNAGAHSLTSFSTASRDSATTLPQLSITAS